ncbi:MAG: hypothetical protein EON58_02575 [Alphaproteobacteria bacterium]|nr:MAG: hypothetical protein EON58_02575 [Alphaproteobacteria bacterium]
MVGMVCAALVLGGEGDRFVPLELSFEIGQMLARSGRFLTSVTEDEAVSFDQEGRIVDRWKRPPHVKALGIDDAGRPVFWRQKGFFTDIGSPQGSVDPAYAPLGVWGGHVVSRIAPNHIAVSSGKEKIRVIGFPKGYVYRSSAYDGRSGSLALMLGDGRANQSRLCLMNPPKYKPIVSKRNEVEFLDSIEYDDAGNLLVLRRSPKSPDGDLNELWDLVRIGAKDGRELSVLATVPIDDPYNDVLAVMRGKATIFVRSNARKGWLVHDRAK